jgi:hypothetical protein
METPAEKGKARLGVQVHRGAVVEHAPLINLLEDDNFVRVKKVASDGYAPRSRESAAKKSRRALAPVLSAVALDEWLPSRSRAGNGTCPPYLTIV